MNRDSLARKANIHSLYMEEKYKNDIANSVKHSIIHRSSVAGIVDTLKSMKIYVVAMDSVGAVFKYADECTALLNFADFKKAGGGFLRGSFAQEEAICHESTLFNVLLRLPDYYTVNRQLVNNSLYKNAAIYSQDIVFERNGLLPVYCDVITCAAPNWRAAKKYPDVSWEMNCEVMKERIDFMLNVAMQHDVDTLILGAWGCGAFEQDPMIVADLFKEALKKYDCFETVVFAIPSGYNHDVFRKVLG